MRVFLDANVLFAGANPESQVARLVKLIISAICMVKPSMG